MGAFWLLLIALIVWLVLMLVPSRSPGPPPGRSALDMLDRRLAVGEIDLQTYHELRAALLAPHREPG